MKTGKRALTVLIFVAVILTVGLLCGCEDLFATKINLAFDSEIVFEQDFFVYTSEEIKPAVTLKHRDKIVDPADYTLSFSNNIDPGSAKAIAQGVGNYYGKVEAAFAIGYAYTFNANGADNVDGELSQSVLSKDDLLPPTVSKAGYTFSHWTFDTKVVDFDDLDAIPPVGEFVANFVLSKYSVTYHLGGGENSPLNKTEYTVEDTFELNDAKLSGKRFGGWYTDAKFTHRIVSLEGYSQDLDLYAKFGEYTDKTLSFNVPDGAIAVPSELLSPETLLSPPDGQTKIIDGKNKRLVWYADAGFTVKYIFRAMPDGDVTVYARWEEVVNAGFLNRMDEFLSGDISIDSYEELVDYVDYVCFYNISDSMDALNWVKVNYTPKSGIIDDDIVKALNVDGEYPRMVTASRVVRQDKKAFKLTLTTDTFAGEATMSSTNREDYAVQLGNIFALSSSGREAGYDKFPIDFVQKTFSVSTSNQLFYVLSRGYRPLPVAGSKAERVYGEFRRIMLDICDDGMTDLEKVRAIFEWIIINVQYDNAVAYPDTSTHIGQLASQADSRYLFDAFYLEGVLRGSAVCDGMSKAYSVMCAIEGIDCVRVTGEAIADNVGHAWNKVQILGNWYVTDATWGNTALASGDEFISYKYMLFTDGERQDFVKQNCSAYVADSKFDYASYYSSRKFQVNGYVADLYIDSAKELSYILEYINFNCDLDSLSGNAFNIMIDQSLLKSSDYDTVNSLYNDALNAYRSRYFGVGGLRFGIKNVIFEDNTPDSYKVIYTFE